MLKSQNKFVPLLFHRKKGRLNDCWNALNLNKPANALGSWDRCEAPGDDLNGFGSSCALNQTLYVRSCDHGINHKALAAAAPNCLALARRPVPTPPPARNFSQGSCRPSPTLPAGRARRSSLARERPQEKGRPRSFSSREPLLMVCYSIRSQRRLSSRRRCPCITRG